MANRLKKQIIFDLFADKESPLYAYYDSLSAAYDDIKKYMEANGFEHRQGSSYISKSALSDKQVRTFLKSMCKELPWLSECSKAFDIANIGKEHSLLKYIEKTCALYAVEKEKWLHRIKESRIYPDNNQQSSRNVIQKNADRHKIENVKDVIESAKAKTRNDAQNRAINTKKQLNR